MTDQHVPAPNCSISQSGSLRLVWFGLVDEVYVGIYQLLLVLIWRVLSRPSLDSRFWIFHLFSLANSGGAN